MNGERQQIIGKGKYVQFTYRILDSSSRTILEYSDLPMGYVHGHPNRMFAPVEHELEGKSAGDTVEVTLSPGEAFGDRRSELSYTDDLENVPGQFRHVGAEVEFRNDRGESRVFVVTHIGDGKLTVDGNHPLAGKTLTFVVTVEDVRDATAEEIRGQSAPLFST
jgi:FKBP-type peptidyl-prolyl cis-trans isomerase SlyD